jgi:tetratricopeptide (TPR) repeat protein
MRFIYLPLFALLIVLGGCGKNAGSSEAREERNPLIKQGHAYMEIKDYAKAETAFRQAIENDSRLARPYLDLAVLYHQYKPDYISAIYCYQRYLELRPDTEKRAFIQEQLVEAKKALANYILTQARAFEAVEELEQLRRENAQLRRQLAARSAGSTPDAGTKSVTETAAPAAEQPSGHQIYTVMEGDTLTKIATEFYGTADWEALYEANKDRMKSPRDLRVGQTLVIPAR